MFDKFAATKTKPLIMAHRGNKLNCPENTLAAFQRAIEEGADIIETDLHLSADGVFMCIHDATIDRTTDGSGAVADLTVAELKRFSASCGLEDYADERIPTLSEVNAILPPDVLLALELKTDRFLEPEVCQQLADQLAAENVRDRAFVLSFSIERLQTVRQTTLDIPTGLITGERLFPISGVDMTGAYWPLLIVNPFYVLLAHLRGQAFCPLDPTPDKRLWYYRLLGVEAVLTDDPGSTLKKLKRG
ncbi:MAG: hypothetical protein JXB38_09320 [Anaerolineales bacterium]|nr:hypothetical protein [Anaerolineales bacterium]